MRRIFILISIMLVLVGVAYTLYKNKKDQNVTFNRAESNFRIEDPNAVGRIVITQKNGKRSDLRRVDDHWTINDQHRARQSSVDFLLTGIKLQQLDHIPNKAATENILKYIAVDGIHVAIFDRKDQPLLSYYVGGVTQDEYGTFFLKENSAQPYCLVQPGFDGSLRVRYAIEPEDWRDVRFWMEDNDSIDSLVVDYPQQHQHAFIISKKRDAYDVTPLYKTTPILKGKASTQLVRSYLTNLSQLACEDFINDIPEKDSILQLQPFMEMKISYPERTSRLRFFAAGQPQTSEYSAKYAKYFIDYAGHDFMIGQYDVIKGAFRSYDYFFEK